MTAPQRFRKRPIEIEAMQWTGDNADALAQWTDGSFWTIDPEDRTDDQPPPPRPDGPPHPACRVCGARMNVWGRVCVDCLNDETKDES